jgi:hypothetical protein
MNNEAKNHLQQVAEQILDDRMESGYDIEELIDQEVEWLSGQDYPLVEEAGDPKKLRELISQAVDKNLWRRG